MTDYAEEQRNEIEALEAIYPDELNILAKVPFCVFQLQVKAEARDGDEECYANCTLQFTYTAKYPDESPVIEVADCEEMDSDDQAKLLELLTEQANENLGMVMVFTLVSAAQEFIHGHAEEMVKRRLDQAEVQKEKERQAEQRRFEGTVVTIESFLAWKAKFDAERAEIKRLRGDAVRKEKGMTGREMFLNDHTLDDSDVVFLESDVGSLVEVDESLFQDLGDLELDDDLES